MRIVGTGVDIVEIKRIKKAAQNQAFLNRVFAPEELAYSLPSVKKWERLAVRFAAKEAAWKAIGKEGLWLKQIVIERLSNGKPVLNLQKLGFPKGWKASITLSHSDNYAVAYCLVYQQ
ncbi:MAG: holo-ACP synthase [Elusimicrobia bacterium]|nr:holo-ACP synthase [Elusimicrobiota bacterium]